jgi:hypothetical protein
MRTAAKLLPASINRNSAFMATVNEGNPRNEIERLKVEIDELAAKIESCRKFILAGRIAVAGGGVALIATLVWCSPLPNTTASLKSSQ